MRASSPFLLVAVLLTGCAVPNITIVPDDGSAVDVTTPDVTSGDDSSVDGTTDGGLDSGDADAADGNAGTCALDAQADASVCCGDVVCSGDCSQATCTQCSKCNATQVCCVRGPSITCHPLGSTCP